MTIKSIIVAVSLVLPGLQAFGASVAAKKDGVGVYAEPSKKATKLTTLKKDEAVESLQRKGMFWQVKLGDGKEGFVMFTQVKRTTGGSSELSKAIQAAAQDSRDMDGVKSARSRSAVMGVRGLAEGEEVSAAGNARPNLRMVYQMEDRQVTNKKINRLAELVQKEVEMKMKER